MITASCEINQEWSQQKFWFRRMVPPAVIQQCARDLERLGQITLKSDQEAAIVDVLGEVTNLRGSRGTLLEHSLVADSRSNGLIERGIRSVEEMTRVLLFNLSSRVGSPISVHSPVFPWIVEHATHILNTCHVASDGKSACEKLKKRPHRGELLQFAASVMFRVAGKVSGGLMKERWHLGSTQKNTLWKTALWSDQGQ